MFTRAHAELTQVTIAGTRQHDAGPIVIIEQHGSLQRAGRKNRLLRADYPVTLPRHGRRTISYVVRDPLHEANDVAVVVSERGTTPQHGDVLVSLQRCKSADHPVVYC